MKDRFFQILYLIGALLTLVAAGIAIWPDFESRGFSQTFTGKDRANLRCPIAMTTDEVSEVSINLRNPLERRIRFAAISFVSSNNQASIPAEERQEVFVEPSSSEQLTWQIDQSNRVYDNMILARIYVFQSGRVPSQSESCGVWLFESNRLANSGLSGQTIYLTFLGISLIFLTVGGMGASNMKNPLAIIDRSTGRPRAGVVFTILILIALACGLFGFPLAGVFIILAAVLLMVALIERPSGSLDI